MFKKILSILLAGLTAIRGAERAEDKDLEYTGRLQSNGTSQPKGKPTGAAKLKREAKKRRNIRARSSKK